MVRKGKRTKKINIKKERQKLIKERLKKLEKEDIQVDKKSLKEIDIRLEKETKLYWIRALIGALSGFIGRIIGLIGWSLFIWMLCFWFITPFFVSFVILKYEYDKEKWNWKNIIKPGIGIFFFLFMIVAIIIHTLLAFL
ncbi:MAG: hypothetical protein ACTSUL_05405 [Promethearchaeota archaeon]